MSPEQAAVKFFILAEAAFVLNKYKLGRHRSQLL